MGPSEGGTNIRLVGNGLYDSTIKRIKFSTSKGTREVQATWEHKRKSISCIVPPLTWLFGGDEVPESVIQEVIKSGVKVSLTFNNQEWIEVPSYKYHDIVVTRLAYVTAFGEEIEDEAQRKKLWHSEEAILAPPAEASEEEIKKWKEEKTKKADEESEEVITVAKRFGSKMYIHGEEFIKKEDKLKVRFSLGDKKVEVTPIFKNTKKLALEIPDLGEDVEIGQHQVYVDVSVNGQNYTNSGKYFMYSAIDRNMSEEELKKLQEAEEKAKAKGGKKK